MCKRVDYNSATSAVLYIEDFVQLVSAFVAAGELNSDGFGA